MRFWVATLLLLGCGDDPTGPDASLPDASLPDASLPDVGRADARPADTGARDANQANPDAQADADHDAGGLCPTPPSVNALREGDAVRALYDGMQSLSLVGDEIVAHDRTHAERYRARVGAGTLLGGFDLDADGVTDFAVAHAEATGTSCGADPMHRTWLTFHRGVDGSSVGSTSPEEDRCWMFPSATYPTRQWVQGTVSHGGGAELVWSATYATTSFLASWQPDGFVTHSFYFPSTASFGATYSAARQNAYGTTSHVESSHVANGLVVDVAGERRAVLFTSARVFQVAFEPLGGMQLRADAPFLSNGRSDIAGRNYGLVAVDPAAPDAVALVAGTSARTFYDDMRAGTLSHDPWGGIERHVAIYSLRANTVSDRFYSYAHDAADGHQYEGRVAYPAHTFDRSRIGYSVYSGGHWFLHVSEPGSTVDALAVRGAFLWDIVDIDGDGENEWIVSPTEDASDPDVPGYYFSKWRTEVRRFVSSTTGFEIVATFEGAIPELVQRFTEPHTTSSAGFLEPVAIATEACAPAMVLREASGSLRIERL